MGTIDYIALLRDRALILGEYDFSKVGGLPPQFFWDRQTMVDFRGDLRICPLNVTFGRGVRILTASHDFSSGEVGPTVYKKVHIGQHVFVGGYSLLYNCILQHHSVVACGSVVRNMLVPSFCMIEGNPARIIKRFIDGRWESFSGRNL